MRKRIVLRHEFVEFIPQELAERTLYISIRFRTASHLCACGCGNRVVTPITPTDWKLLFDGKTVSLYPSIGNWSFPCRSHYRVVHNQVRWCSQWSEEEIEEGREADRSVKAMYFLSAAESLQPSLNNENKEHPAEQSKAERKQRLDVRH